MNRQLPPMDSGHDAFGYSRTDYAHIAPGVKGPCTSPSLMRACDACLRVSMYYGQVCAFDSTNIHTYRKKSG